MRFSIPSTQPRTEITGSYKKDYDEFRIIIVRSQCDTYLCFFLPNAYAQINELSTFYKNQNLTKRFKNLQFLIFMPTAWVRIRGLGELQHPSSLAKKWKFPFEKHLQN